MTSRKSFLQEHGLFVLFFGGLFLTFLYPLVFMRQGFTLGDYESQFYPWSWAYAQELKQGRLLLWTPLIQSGFPLFAEGQTAMLYPLHLLFFGLLPFKLAYNLVFLTHFLMGGLFSYLFASKKGLSRPASTLVALSFTFGSAYAGCFYNIVTMRSLVWFPLALWLIEEYLDKRTWLPLACLSLVQIQSWLGGFPQTAAYHALFVTLYFFLRARELKKIPVFPFLTVMACSVLVAVPQLWATLELAGHSTRLLQEKGFALWGSVAPWSLVGLFLYPWSVFFRANLYIGIFPLMAVLLTPDWKKQRVFWLLLAVSFLLALGSFNPLYQILMRLPGASLLRNPAKFLFFSAFFLAMLAGHGYDALAQSAARGGKNSITRALRWLAVFAGIAAAGWAMAHFGEALLRSFGEWYVRAFVMERSYHRGSWEHYAANIEGILAIVRGELDIRKRFFWVPFLFAMLFILQLRFFKKKGPSKNLFHILFLSGVVFDLFLYGSYFYGAGFIGNMNTFPETPQRILPRDGKWMEPISTQRAWFSPNRNMLTGHAIAGGYSPLLDKDYFLLMKGSGLLDDAFGAQAPDLDFRRDRKDLIDFLGVRYIHTNEDGAKYFVNDSAGTEFSLRSVNENGGAVHVLDQGPLEARIEVFAPEGGQLVRNQVFDRSWKVSIDGAPAVLERADRVFQGVALEPGRHEVRLRFDPDYLRTGAWFAFLGSTILLAGFFVRRP